MGNTVNEKSEFAEFRQRLEGYLRERAASAGLQVNPTRRPPQDLALAERLYEETLADRQFIASLSSDGQLDAFTKRTGLNEDVYLLQVFIRLSEQDFPITWNLYFKWMCEGVSENSIMEYIRQYPDWDGG